MEINAYFYSLLLWFIFNTSNITVNAIVVFKSRDILSMIDVKYMIKTIKFFEDV